MNNWDQLLERLADLEHQQWEEWSKAVAPEVSDERRARWEKYWVPYAQLDESTKDQDREWAEKVLTIVMPFLADEGKEMKHEAEPEIKEDKAFEDLENGPAAGCDNYDDSKDACLDDAEEELPFLKARKKEAREVVMEVDSAKFPALARILHPVTLSRVLTEGKGTE